MVYIAPPRHCQVNSVRPVGYVEPDVQSRGPCHAGENCETSKLSHFLSRGRAVPG
jgi:hypothetical protein